MSQISIFDGSRQFKLNKPIRLIELFAGYGSQSLALKYLGVDFESWKICEWAVKSIQAYKDIHFDKDNTDYSDGHSKEYILNRLLRWGISANYNEPMTKQQIMRLGEEKQRTIYNNIKATHNLVNIQQVNGSDLEIVDTDKYCYVMTYSFPCQDLSRAGKGKGMAKDSGTRSGMLWEVERILDECLIANQLPQVLLMENVPDVIGTKNIGYFSNWISKLEWLGYKNKWQVLNAKDYGIPQNRERCFMVSILGDYYYDFPTKIPLINRLKDLLEDEVDEKYYISEKALRGALNTNFCCSKLENKLPNGIVPTLMARDYKDPKLVEITTGQSQGNRVYDINGLSVSLCANGGGLGAKTGLYLEPKKIDLKAQLCNELINSGKVKEGDVIRHSYTNSRMKDSKVSNSSAPDCSPTLDTRCDCLGVVVKSKNKRIIETAKKLDLAIDGQFMDVFNQTNKQDVSGTLLAGMDSHQGNIVYNNYRIRKLTPKECFRLMGVKDKDFAKVERNQSNSSLYHLAGDSIVVNVLMAIFKKML